MIPLPSPGSRQALSGNGVHDVTLLPPRAVDQPTTLPPDRTLGCARSVSCVRLDLQHVVEPLAHAPVASDVRA